MASSSRMTAAMTCSCTSALSNVPGSGRCVKARRSPTKSSPIAALANLRPTISALPDKRFFKAPTAALKNCPGYSERPHHNGAAFFLSARATSDRASEMPGADNAVGSGFGAGGGIVHHAGRLPRTGIGEIAHVDPGFRHDETDVRNIVVADLAVDQIGVADLECARNRDRGSGSARRGSLAPLHP